MYISKESPEQTERRLRRVIARATLRVRDETFWFDEFPPGELSERVRGDAIAVVRDEMCWSQLVPVRDRDRPLERFRVWTFHFEDGSDNSGFVGWLAARIKRRTGSGILVVCGRNSQRGGIYDHWGCPESVWPDALAEVKALAAGGESGSPETQRALLDGLHMRVAATADAGEVGGDTLFAFAQEGSTVSARYAGGNVKLGYLVGTLTAPATLEFRYAQVGAGGRIDSGHSTCDVSRDADGRTRLREHFTWDTREGSGTNVLEDVRPLSRSVIGSGQRRRSLRREKGMR